MPFFTTALIAGGLAAAGSLGGAAIASSAAGNAANAQVNAADYAANLQYQSGQNALDFQKSQWAQQQANVAPWLQTGTNAISTLDQLMGLNPPGTGGGTSTIGGASTTAGGTTSPSLPPLQNIPGGSMYSRGIGMLNDGSTLAGRSATPGSAAIPGTAQPQGTAIRPGGPAPGVANGNLVPFAPWNQQFTPPTDVTQQNDPGYKFRLSQGLGALENSAAARGGLLSGNTAQAEQQFGQDYASNEYNNVYQRALGQYQQNYNIYENNQANQWNRLAALAGYGQTAVGQLGAAGSNASNNVTNILTGTASNIGKDVMSAGNARASGYANQGNAFGGAFSSLGSLGSLLPFMSMLNSNPANQPGPSTGGV
jgi:hypothetical protein